MKNPDIIQFKKDVFESVNHWFDEAGQYLTRIYDEIEVAKKELSSITLQYTTILKDSEKIKSELSSIDSKLKQEKQQFYNERDEYNAKKDIAQNQLKLILKEINTKIDTRDKLITEIEKIKSELVSIESLKGVKETLTKEVELLNEQAKAQRDAIQKSEDESKENLRKDMELCGNARKELESINKEIELAKSIVLPKINEIEDREKAVTKREEDMKIVINRYKKLYADNDATFLI